MFEEWWSCLSSMWASVNAWFTPTVLFIFLNLTICTIAITSSTLATPKPHPHPPQSQLHSLKSPESNLHFHFERHDEQQEEQPIIDRSPPVLLRMKSLHLDHYFSRDKQTSDEIYGHSHSRESGEIPITVRRKMEKSGSSKSVFSQFVEEDIWKSESRRPEKKPKAMEVEVEVEVEVEEEVDAKADDFINKFKHQLKLQRIDSITRYKKMISRINENDIVNL